MSETHTPAGNVGAALQRATVGEAATGTHGDEFMRQNITKIGDKIRYLKDTGHLSFPAVQVTDADPNVLDDYEEGTFTPLLTFGGGSTGITYTVQVGSYVKIGKLVAIHIRVALTNKGSSAGAAKVGGLPFTLPASRYGSFAFYYANLASIAGAVMGLAQASTSNCDLFVGSAASVAALTEANFTNSSDLILSFVYEV